MECNQMEWNGMECNGFNSIAMEWNLTERNDWEIASALLQACDHEVCFLFRLNLIGVPECIK